jgi:hypothetical protein
MTTDDWASSQASATCWALTPRALATCWKAGWWVASSLASDSPPSGAPGQEGQAQLGADLDLGPAAAELRAELVLHADQAVAQRLVRRPDLAGVGVGQPDHPHLAAGSDLGQCADGLGVVDLGVGAVVLPQRDLLDPEPGQAGVDSPVQVLRASVVVPAAAMGAEGTALGGQEHAVADAQLVEDRGDELLVLALGVWAQLLARP